MVMDIPCNIFLDGYPSLSVQFLTTLINNAALYVFGTQRVSALHLQARVLQDAQMQSTPGQGSCFVVRLPPVAPHHAEDYRRLA